MAKRTSEDKIEWLKANFADKTNEELANHLGISHSSIHRYARMFSLKKSAELMKRTQANATRLARIANARRGWPPKGYRIPRSEEFCFKKGETNIMRLGAEKEAERLRKAQEKRNASIRADRLRIKWGLEQKTKMKLNGTFRHKTYIRWAMRKLGYEVERGSNEVVVSARTQRSELHERNCRKCGIRIVVR